MPDRILYLGDRRDSRVIQLHESKGEMQQYVALSYCWGGKTQYVLNARTRPEMAKAIDATYLPQTIRDAIDLTRELGLRYIWVDALCIRQDSREDWERQSLDMGSIYRNASLTLITSRAAAVTEGFLLPTKPHATHCGVATFKGQRKSVYLVADPENPLHSLDPLSRRGWAFQERQMSTCKVVFGSACLLYTSPSPRDGLLSRMPSSA